MSDEGSFSDDFSEDDFDVKKFLKDIDEALPKYKKTLAFIINQIPKADNFLIEDDLQDEAEKLKKTIHNLEITKSVYEREVKPKAETTTLEKITPKETTTREKMILEEARLGLKSFSIDAIIEEPKEKKIKKK